MKTKLDRHLFLMCFSEIDGDLFDIPCSGRTCRKDGKKEEMLGTTSSYNFDNI